MDHIPDIQVLRAHTGQLYAAGLLAVLLAAFFATLTRLVPEGSPGWGLLRVSPAGCVITQTMVATGASSGLAGVHAAAGTAGAGLVALGWSGLWLTFWAFAVPTIVFTVTGVLGLRQAGLSPPWVSALGWLSAAAHLLVLFTLAQRGPSRPTGSSPGSSRSPPSSGSSPWPPPCPDRSGQASRLPSEPAGEKGHGRSCSYVTHHPARTLPTHWLSACPVPTTSSLRTTAAVSVDR
jgi:hypothetical protein